MTAILKVKDGNGNVIPIQAIKGEKGEKGDRGLPGSGGVPDGGTTGQVLTKNSNADGDAGWKDSVQADWNENNDSSRAFVNGRTHYTEYEKQFSFDYNADRQAYVITSPVALDTEKTYELVFEYDIKNGSSTQANALIKFNVINPVTYKASWLGKFTQKTKYGATFWCFNNIHPADSSFLPCIYSSDMKSFNGYITNCVNNEAWLNEIKIAVPLDLKYIPETIARVSDVVMGTGEKQVFGSAAKEQICSNIGALYLGDLSGYLSEKLDKNQGTANSGKFLGIGADGIVVPTEVGGGSEWVTLFNGTIATEEAVNSMSADLLKSCEGMNEFLVWYTNTKNTVETPGNDNSEVTIGKANYGYGRFGDLTSDNEKIVHLLLTDNITYSYVIDTRGNSMQFNTGTGTGGWSSNKAKPDYNKVKIACFNGTYIGTISLKIYGR